MKNYVDFDLICSKMC